MMYTTCGGRLIIDVSVIMAANLDDELASEKFCESTIGCRDAATSMILEEPERFSRRIR